MILFRKSHVGHLKRKWWNTNFIMKYLAEDGFDFFMVGHHVDEEVDSNLKKKVFAD